MADPFTTNGAAQDKPSKYAPLLVNEFWSGQYSNSNPLREAATPYLYQKFYSGSRFETIRSGQNVEISPRLTPIRRAGHSIYNSQSFANVDGFYAFRTFNSLTGAAGIRVIVDTATGVYDGTGPSTQALLFTKKSGAKQTSFQSLGNTLYAADSVSQWKWVWAPAWAADTTYTTGQIILDSNNNIQKLTGVNIAAGLTFQQVQVINDVVYISWNSTGVNARTQGNFTAAQLAQLPGSTVTLSGFTGATFLNGQTVTITSAKNQNIHVGSTYSWSATLTFSFTNSNYGPTSDVGLVNAASGSGESGGSLPSFSSTIGATTADGSNLTWTCKGPSVQNWGIVAPVSAPSVSNVFAPAGNAWVGSTYFWPYVNGANYPLLLDPNGNIQLLTTAGTTNSSVPAFNTSGTTTDGSAVWTFQGSGTRATSTSYAQGAFIAVTVTTTYQKVVGVAGGTKSVAGNGSGGGTTIYQTVTTTNYYFFEAQAAGTSSSTATGSITWPTSLGGTVSDGTVVWQNVGYQVQRTTAASSSPAQNTQGNLGDSTKVETYGLIVDDVGSGGGSGFSQSCVLAGLSASTHPTWATSSSVELAGLITTDNGIQWLNGGPAGAANTGSWVYGYSYGNSVTGHQSSLSALSAPVTLQAQSVIGIGGSGDPNWQTDGVDTINIYRSTQGATTPFFLISIPAPASGAAWSYNDASPDPPNPGAILNEFIEGDTTGTNAPPPSNLWQLTYYLGDIFGSAGVFQYYSEPSTWPIGVGAESWPGSQNVQLPEIITKSWASASGLLILTTCGIWFSTGTTGSPDFAPLPPTQILTDIGLLSPTLFTVNGSVPCILTSDLQMISLNPSSGIERYNDPIADTANGMGGFSNISSFLTFHTYNEDSGFFLADGSTGWFRLIATPAPENNPTGFTWSVKANIAGGAGAVQSIETSPGVKQLLVASGGNILYRNTSTNADNGTAYPASFVIGSLVFAQPHCCAEINSISTYCLAVGSRIQVSVLCNEVSATAAVPFELMQNRTPEPATLPLPQSTYSDRWYFSGNISASAWLQHMQIQFAWPTENFANELLQFGVYGCVHRGPAI